jgi:hypothetical protein
MKIGKRQIDAQTLEDCLDILEAAFQSEMWRRLVGQERIRLVGRLSHIFGDR